MLLGCSMAIKSTLESRRRLQTSRKIQWAALKLALRYGYDDMTTEMIAAAAGISQRTFFNYYPNKGAAIIGPSTGFDDQAAAWFRASSGSLLADLLQALYQHLANIVVDHSTPQVIGELLGTSPELQRILDGVLKQFGNQIADLLVTRMGKEARRDAELLGTVVSHALGNTICSWANDQAMSANSIIEVSSSTLQALRGNLALI